MAKLRLDEWLVDNGHYATRARARDAILRGCVTMAGEGSIKPSRTVVDPASVKINDPALQLVSRAALKLSAALEVTAYNPSGKICLDLGASTGGFCQVLLDNNAAHVYAVDVGHDQMAASLLNHPRLTNLEGLNARDLSLDDLNDQKPGFITCDVSFISLRLALPPALEIAAPGAIGIFLIKPQFEVGKDGIGRGGIVREEELAISTAHDLRDWLPQNSGWECTHFMQSPIKGGDGNQEYLMAGIKQ